MKKEVFIMHDFKALCRQAHTLVIFKSLHEVPVFEKLLETLAVCESDSDMAIEKYSDFVAELFAYSDNLTEYMLKLVLENENLFMLKKGEGKETGYDGQKRIYHEYRQYGLSSTGIQKDRE